MRAFAISSAALCLVGCVSTVGSLGPADQVGVFTKTVTAALQACGHRETEQNAVETKFRAAGFKVTRGESYGVGVPDSSYGTKGGINAVLTPKRYGRGPHSDFLGSTKHTGFCRVSVNSPVPGALAQPTLQDLQSVGGIANVKLDQSKTQARTSFSFKDVRSGVSFSGSFARLWTQGENPFKDKNTPPKALRIEIERVHSSL